MTHPTTAPFAEQLQAIRTRVGELLDAAGAAGCKIVCLQEAWTMPFAFCTREKQVRRPSLLLCAALPLPQPNPGSRCSARPSCGDADELSHAD